MLLSSTNESGCTVLNSLYISQQMFCMAIQKQKTNVGVSRTLRNKSVCCAHTTQQSFNAATLTLVVANSVAVALIVSYLILLLTTTG